MFGNPSLAKFQRKTRTKKQRRIMCIYGKIRKLFCPKRTFSTQTNVFRLLFVEYKGNMMILSVGAPTPPNDYISLILSQNAKKAFVCMEKDPFCSFKKTLVFGFGHIISYFLLRSFLSVCTPAFEGHPCL